MEEASAWAVLVASEWAAEDQLMDEPEELLQEAANVLVVVAQG